jgi:hypothetical protein
MSGATELLPKHEARRREHLLWVLSAMAFLVFFQARMVVPLIPRLATVFGAPIEKVGLINRLRRVYVQNDVAPLAGPFHSSIWLVTDVSSYTRCAQTELSPGRPSGKGA